MFDKALDMFHILIRRKQWDRLNKKALLNLNMQITTTLTLYFLKTMGLQSLVLGF